MGHRIVLQRYGCVAGSPLCNHGDIHRHFFACLHCHVLHFPVFDKNVSAFVDGIFGRDLVPIFRDEYSDARIARAFFIVRGQKNHVAVQARICTLQSDERGQVRCQHSFVVHGATAINVPVLCHCAERIDRPFRAFHAYNIHVRNQQQCLRWIGEGRAGQPRHQSAPPRLEWQQFRLNSLFLQNPRKIFRGGFFIPWWICRVDFDQIGQPPCCFPCKCGRIGELPTCLRRSRRRHARNLSACPGGENGQRQRTQHQFLHTSHVRHGFVSTICLLGDRNRALGGRLANVFHRICFILTCDQRAPSRCKHCAFLSSTVGYWRAARVVYWGME